MKSRHSVAVSENPVAATNSMLVATKHVGTEIVADRPVGRGLGVERPTIIHGVQIQPVPTQRLFGVSAAAKYLGISDDTLRKYADLGKIPVYRFINGHRAFKLEDLNTLIDNLPLWHDPASDTTRAGRNGGIA